jgi:hypothetical protein
VELLQRGRLACSSGAAQANRPVAGGEHLVHGVLLVRPQPKGRHEGVIAAQPASKAPRPRLTTAIICRSRSRLSSVAT